MRLRHNKNAYPYLLEHKDKVLIFNSNFINLEEVFLNKNPIHLEIGCGKGRMFYYLAKEYQDINYLALDKYASVLYYALKRQDDCSLDNLKYLLASADNLDTIFLKNSVDRIYLSFSDPWPKKRHEKRRLTHPNFLNLYKQILKKDGDLIFKTDNLEFFNYSLEQFINNGFKVLELSNDLGNSNINNVLTDYEIKFKDVKKINYLRAKVC